MIKLKDILLEATRDELVLDISRQILFAFKRGDTQYTQSFDLSGPKITGEDDANVELVVTFIKQSPLDYAYSISAGANGEDMDIEITYDPKQFPGAYNNLVAEVKETLEHESEHIQQGIFYKAFIVSNRYDEPLRYPPKGAVAPTHFLYLTSNIEVPAYVKGLIKRAKVKKLSLDAAMEDYYNDYKRIFDAENTDWSKVKKIWMDWAKANKDKLKKYD
tara:strand:- start:253 stop:906 length:654 start_codon:yes stop_codon:yes gene_type:complete